MTQMKKTFKRHTLAGSRACAVAFALATLPLVCGNGEAVGQTPAPAAPAPAVPAPASAAPAPAPGVAASNAPQLSTLAPTPAQPIFGPPASAQPTETIPELRAKIQSLQAQLQRMPTSLAEQQEQQQIYNELIRTQSQLQQMEATQGQFSAYRQERDRQAGVSGLEAAAQLNADPSDPLNPLSAAQRQNRLQALNESGLNAGSVAARTDMGANLTPAEVAMLNEQKEGLLQQYNQIQQTLRALQPGDAALADNLKQEQATLAAQLRDIDARLAAAPRASLDAQRAPQGPAANPFVIPPANQLPQQNFPGGTNNISARMQMVNQAAQLLRQAGLAQLADYATSEVPRLADPNFTETKLTPGSWAEGDGLAESRNNPFKQVGAKEIEQINTKIDDLTAQVQKLTQTLADVETQLKLLTRNSIIATQSPENAALLDAFSPEPSDFAPTSPEANPANAGDDAFGPPFDAAIPESSTQPAATEPALPPIPGEEDIDAPEGSDAPIPEA